MYGFWNNNNTSLCIPAKCNLSRRFSILISNLSEYWICKDSMISFCKWSPCFWLNTKFFHYLKCIFLLEEWMKLYLIYCWYYFCCKTKVCQSFRIEITYTNCLLCMLLPLHGMHHSNRQVADESGISQCNPVLACQGTFGLLLLHLHSLHPEPITLLL